MFLFVVFMSFSFKLFIHHVLMLGNFAVAEHLSGVMRKPTFCLGENKGADQLRSNCEADQRLCFRYMDSTISLLSESAVVAHKEGITLVWVKVCNMSSFIKKPTMWFSNRTDTNRAVKHRRWLEA